MDRNKIYNEDCLQTMSKMEPNSIDLVVTSPPYFGCRQYGDESIGREEDPNHYVDSIFAVTMDIKAVLKKTGSFYLNIGDVYFGSKGFSRNTGKFKRKTDKHYVEHKIVKADGKYLQEKQLLLLPTRIAAKMQDAGWILRNNIIWEKTNPLPADAGDRRMPCYEYIFHFVKSPKYFFDKECAKKIGSDRDVFRASVKPFKEHPAAFTEDIITPLILTTSAPGDLVYDPFMGSGTTAIVAKKHGRDYLGSEINHEYFNKFYPDGVVVTEESRQLYETI